LAQRNGKDYKKYDHARAIRQQIRYVNDKVGEADMEDTQAFQNYFNKVFMAIGSLDAMLNPFKDEEYEDKLSDINPVSASTSEKLQFVRNALTEIYDLLDRQQIFYETRTGREKT